MHQRLLISAAAEQTQNGKTCCPSRNTWIEICDREIGYYVVKLSVAMHKSSQPRPSSWRLRGKQYFLASNSYLFAVQKIDNMVKKKTHQHLSLVKNKKAGHYH